MVLSEQYRPRTWAEVVGQDKAVAILQSIVRRGAGGRAFWLSGASGTGKSTIANILARELADPMAIVEADAGSITPAELRDIESTMAVYGPGEKRGRVWIINEAHGLSRPAIRQLLVLLERLPSHVAVIFTTTTDGQIMVLDEKEDAQPLVDRCVVVALSRQGLAKPFAERAREIAIAEGLDGRDLAAYERLAKDSKNSLRRMLGEIGKGCMKA